MVGTLSGVVAKGAYIPVGLGGDGDLSGTLTGRLSGAAALGGDGALTAEAGKVTEVLFRSLSYRSVEAGLPKPPGSPWQVEWYHSDQTTPLPNRLGIVFQTIGMDEYESGSPGRTATWGGVPMTLHGTNQMGAGLWGWTDVWVLLNPPEGSSQPIVLDYPPDSSALNCDSMGVSMIYSGVGSLGPLQQSEWTSDSEWQVATHVANSAAGHRVVQAFTGFPSKASSLGSYIWFDDSNYTAENCRLDYGSEGFDKPPAITVGDSKGDPSGTQTFTGRVTSGTTILDATIYWMGMSVDLIPPTPLDVGTPK